MAAPLGGYIKDSVLSSVCPGPTYVLTWPQSYQVVYCSVRDIHLLSSNVISNVLRSCLHSMPVNVAVVDDTQNDRPSGEPWQIQLCHADAR